MVSKSQPYDGFSHFALSVNAVEDSLMAMFTLYFDDSGTHSQSDIAIAACYLSTVAEWQTFKRNWEALNEQYRFGIFHMTDFVARAEQFTGWTDAECHSLIVKLISVIRSRTLKGFVAAVVKSDYDKIIPSEYRHRMGFNHYTFAFRQCSSMINAYREEHGLTEPFDYVFESGTKGSGEIMKIFDEASCHTEVQSAFGMIPGGYSFQPKRKVIQLQSADILAWESYRHMRDSVVPTGAPAPAKRKSFQELLKGKHVQAGFFNENNLKILVKRLRQSDIERGKSSV